MHAWRANDPRFTADPQAVNQSSASINEATPTAIR